MATPLNDQAPDSRNSDRPKKLYVAFWYSAGGDDAYKRAATTWKAAIEDSPGFRKKFDHVELIDVGSDNQFKAQWEWLNQQHREKGYDIAGMVIFSHASPDRGHNEPGIDFKDLEKDNDAVLTTRNPNEIGALAKLRFTENAYLTLAGCNTSNENFSSGATVAQAFAIRQGIPVLGNEGYTDFSYTPDKYTGQAWYKGNKNTEETYLLAFNRSLNLANGYGGDKNDKLDVVIPMNLYDKRGNLVPESKHAEYFKTHGMIFDRGITLKDRQEFYQLQQQKAKEDQEKQPQQQPPTPPVKPDLRSSLDQVPLPPSELNRPSSQIDQSIFQKNAIVRYSSLSVAEQRKYLLEIDWAKEGFVPHEGAEPRVFSMKGSQAHEMLIPMYEAKSMRALDPHDMRSPAQIALGEHQQIAQAHASQRRNERSQGDDGLGLG